MILWILSYILHTIIACRKQTKLKHISAEMARLVCEEDKAKFSRNSQIFQKNTLQLLKYLKLKVEEKEQLKSDKNLVTSYVNKVECIL